MNRTDRLTRRTSPGRDPVLLAMKAAAAVLAVVALVMLSHAIGRARAAAAHPCPPGRTAMLAPTGWGCGMSQRVGVKSR